MNNWVEDWLSAVCESERTVTNYTMCISIFSDFCKEHWHKDFSSVVADWRAVKRAPSGESAIFLDDWADVVRNLNTWATKRYAPLSVKNILSAVKSFFGFWDIPVKVRLPKRACVIYHNKDLTKNEVRQILTYASPRDRTIWLVMAESGMRVNTAVHLKYWQIKEDFERGKVPLRIVLPTASLKDRVGDRWTFVGMDGFKALKEYLAPRLPLKDSDYVFTSEKRGKVKGDQFSIHSISVKFSRLVKKLELCESRRGKPKAVRQHGLRKYFRNNMKTETEYRKFWMGYSLGTDEHYITRDVEEHRRRYEQGYPSLRIYEPIVSEELVKEQQSRIEQLELDLREQRELLYRMATLKAKAMSQKDVDELDRLLDRLAKKIYPEHKTEEERIKEFEEAKREKA